DPRRKPCSDINVGALAVGPTQHCYPERRPEPSLREEGKSRGLCYFFSDTSRGHSRLPTDGPGSIMDRMNFGLSEMIFIFLLALLLFGPKRMPEIGRQIGRALNEFRRASNEFKSQIESEIHNLERESSAGEILPPAKPVAGAISTSTPADVIGTEDPSPQQAAA